MTKKFRASLLTGMGVLSLAAVGCGGGGGASLAVQTPPKIVIGAQVNPSMNSVDGSPLRYSLDTLADKTVRPEDIQVFSVDGEDLTNDVNIFCSGNKLPCTVGLLPKAFLKAKEQGTLVFRVKSGTLDYKATSSAIGTLTAGTTHPEQVGVGFGSTVATSFLEDELSKKVGQQIVLGQSSPELAAAAVNQAFGNQASFFTDYYKDVQTAQNTPGSALQEITQQAALNVDPANAATAGGLDVAISAFALRGQNPTNPAARPSAAAVNASRQVAAATAQMVAAIQGESDPVRKDKLGRLKNSVATATKNEASLKSAAANVVSNAVSAQKLASGLQSSLDEVMTAVSSGAVNDTVAKSLIQKTGEEVLPAMTDEVVQTLAKGGNEGLAAQITGGVMTGAEYLDDADKKNELNAIAGAKLTEVVNSLPEEGQKKVLAEAMSATSASTAAFSGVVQAIVDSGKNVVDVITSNQNSSTANTADVVRAATEYAATSGGSENIGFSSKEDLLQNLAGKLGASAVALAQTQQNIVLSDLAKVRPETVEVKVGQTIIVANASIEGDATKTYTYKWKRGSTVLSTNPSYLTTVAAAAGTYSIDLEQSRNGTAVGTATVAVTVIAEAVLRAPILISSRANTDRLDIFKARTATVNLDVIETEETSTRALTIKANVTGTSGGVIAKWGTKALSGAQTIVRADAINGLRIPVTIEAVTEGDYTIEFVLGYGSNGEVKKAVTVRVNPPAPKQISIVNLPTSYKIAAVNPADLKVVTSLYSEQSSGNVTMILKIGTSASSLTTTIMERAISITAAGRTTYETDLAVTTSQVVGDLEAGKNYVLELSLLESDLATRYVTKALSVYGEGAPVITGLRIARNIGGTLGTKTTLNNGGVYALSSTNPASVVLNMEVLTSAADGVATPTAYSVSAGSWSTGSSVATTNIDNIAEGKVEYTVTANAGTKSAVWRFFVDVRRIYEISVSNLTLSGAVSGAATGLETATVSILPYNASGLNGVSLTDQTLKVALVTATTVLAGTATETYDPNIRLKVSLTDPNSSRSASMDIEGAVLALSSEGFDITTASSITAGAVRSDGTEVSRTLATNSVTDFAGLFTAARDGSNAVLEVNVYKLKEAIKEVLVGDYPSFASRIDEMTGQNLRLQISVTPSRMIVKSGTSQISGFEFKNITVQ
jgi:hypothetical protein